MTHKIQKLPSLKTVKVQAKRLRAKLSTKHTAISHSESLELVAHQFGFDDWNTLHAAIGNRPPASPLNIGDNVKGRYLGQPFTAEVLSIKVIGQVKENSNRFRLTLNLETPVDVVTFESFSSFRKRINCTIDRSGMSAERTSNGQPQMVIELSP